MTSHRDFFWRCFISLVKFSCWSKFHDNIITGSGVMKIFLLYPPLSFAQYLEANAILLPMKLCDLLQGLSKVNFKSKSENTQWVSQWKHTASKHQTCLKVYQEFRKIRKVEKRVYLMNSILIKLRMCSNFAGISHYYLWYLVTC